MKTTRLPRVLVAIGFVAAVLGGAPGIARAKDLCVTIYGYPAPFVLRSFSLPGKGKCKPLAGSLGGSAISGTACTSSDGTTEHVMILDQSIETNAFDAHLPFPSSTFDQYCIASSAYPGSCSSGASVSVAYCASPVTIP
jgi:hypothetical protein